MSTQAAMRGINESHYLSDEHSVLSSDVEGSVSGGAGNVYEVEHLATFQLSDDLTAPADGMRRLLHMEKNGFGIWSQKMRIRLENRFIVILDFENGDEMERFPLHLIRDPTAFTNPNPGELYNNIFAFIVQPVEMHIFQCFNISGAELVEDVKLALSGRLPPNRTRHGSQNSLPPPPVNPPPEPPHFPLQNSGDEQRDDASLVDDEILYEREVAILNRCFDDIERFIARLQYAAAAFRELQRRRKSKKSKKKDHGEGLLSMRGRPPHEREFIDILQKFKLSFNLLALLKTHIHDPNAPELVHFLFTPLALIVDASRDAHPPGLASRVVSPLLNREAIELLNNCLTSKETELWHSLGEAWLLAREQFKGFVAPYQPVFMDGWSPAVWRRNLGAAVASEAQRRFQEIRATQHENEQRRVAARERSVSPVEMTGDDFGSGQRAFVDSLRRAGRRVVVVTHPRTANNHKELTVIRGEYLELIDDSKKWWRAKNWKGQTAHVPHTIVSQLGEFPQDNSYYPGDNGRAGATYSPPSSSMSSDEDGLPNRNNRSTSPASPVSQVEPDSANRSSSSSPAVPRNNKVVKKIPKDEEDLHLELKNVLTLFREKRIIAIPRTPEVYINQHSSAAEVKEWLQAKGFSPKVQKQLNDLTGEQIFSLKRHQLEDLCGEKEGRRLDSQITISRNTSGFKTARSSELRAILARARVKAEQGDDSSFASNKSNEKELPKARPSSKETRRDRTSSDSDSPAPVIAPTPKKESKSPSKSRRAHLSSDSDSPAPVIAPTPKKESKSSSKSSSKSPSSKSPSKSSKSSKSSSAPPPVPPPLPPASESFDIDSDDLPSYSDNDDTKSTLHRQLKDKHRKMTANRRKLNQK